ncbi:lebercilin [Echeneis naucrates]|uniref:Lebercilin-like n=1 Tax=Echeneis naucrates TaxID=173247 RepID=A0A665V5P5_ECHNA|nr:lebercilin-like [Echeneis naucrates]
MSDNMESENATEREYEDNRDVNLTHQSLRSKKKNSQSSSFQKDNNNSQKKNTDDDIDKDSNVESRSKTRTWHSDPDRDQMSDREGQRSSGSFYSEDYENESLSEHSLSQYSRSRTPSPIPQKEVRAKRFSGSPIYKTGGVWRHGVSRTQRLGGPPLTHQHRKGVRTQSKESTPPKDLDLVTKRMLSARLLKINELHNALSELQQRTDELQRENRILRQLQVRQEKALQRYDDTESEISQLLSRHSNEVHVLRERLRRTQERERLAERRLKDSEEQLQRSQTTISRLKKLVNQRELGARDELSRRLEEEKARFQEAERKLKELERSMELSNSSYQRQLAAERKKTISAQEEIRTLQEELEQITNKLKEKERELDTRNIYANRMIKASQKKDTDSCTKRKVPSRNSTKAVQTEDRPSSLDFPTPPPAITDAHGYNAQGPDEYLSLKELDKGDGPLDTQNCQPKWEHQKMRDKGKDMEKEQEREKQQLNQDLNVLEEKAKRLRDGWEKAMEEEDRKKTNSMSNQETEENSTGEQEEVDRWNNETQSSQRAAEEARWKKEQLLAKMREIDRQNQGAIHSIFAVASPSESIKSTSDHSSPSPPEQKNITSSIFIPTKSEDLAGLRAGAGSREGGRRRPGIEAGAVTTGIGRKAIRTEISNDNLAFGNYAPSFGLSASRGSSGFPPPPPKEDRDSALEAIGVFSLREVETEKEKQMEKGLGKDRKSSLMQQLFGTLSTSAGDSLGSSNHREVLGSPPTTNGVRSRRDALFSFNSGSSTPPASSLSTLHVDSRPAVRAIPSFDDDIEELTL